MNHFNEHEIPGTDLFLYFGHYSICISFKQLGIRVISVYVSRLFVFFCYGKLQILLRYQLTRNILQQWHHHRLLDTRQKITRMMLNYKFLVQLKLRAEAMTSGRDGSSSDSLYILLSFVVYHKYYSYFCFSLQCCCFVLLLRLGLLFLMRRILDYYRTYICIFQNEISCPKLL